MPKKIKAKSVKKRSKPRTKKDLSPFTPTNKTTAFLLAIPFTGLGLYGGFRGNRWLRNRIQIFKQFTLQSLHSQTDQDFVLWLQWRPEEFGNKYVVELEQYLRTQPFKFISTYGGVCMYDDKYEDSVARSRLADSLAKSLPHLFDFVPDAEEIIQLMQPSDDCYRNDTVALMKKVFSQQQVGAISFVQGYLCNYNTMELLEYNPKTNPPFAAIRFPREVFFDVFRHLDYISLKFDVGKYKKGTPLPSHEYLPNCLMTAYFDFRGYLVGTHGENISTHFNHPYGGEKVDPILLSSFGLLPSSGIKLPISIRKWAMRKLPYKVQRKLRYWFGEKFWAKYYSWIRS